ncbi:MAG: MATE family efflux transporter [Pseudobutyrivibrio sp.]|nr:MATE family efflux transporter [Pseudobutyrivibrio sp.]
MLDRKQFIKHAIKLALPIMVQNLISSLVNTADTIMLGYVSQTAMSAASLANQFVFVLFCFFYGLSAGTSVLCAQYWGKGDQKTINRVVGMAIRLSIVISVIAFLIAFIFPTEVMRLFSESPDTVAAGALYLRYVAFSFVFMGVSNMYMSALRSTGRVILPSVTYIVSLVTNVFFNAVFIFGLLGAPKMGVTGAAIGTVIARVVELIICVIYSITVGQVKIKIKYIFAKTGVLFADYMKVSLPSLINDVVWSTATSVFAAILGHIGDDMVAANAVAIMVVNIGAIASRGFANATTIVVSNALGENNKAAAKVYGSRMLKLTILVGLMGGIVLFAIRPLMASYYSDKLTPLALSYLSTIMIMNIWRLLGEGINTCLICGCFRGGSDARFGMIMDIIFMWFVAVPLMAIAAYVLKLPPLLVYLVMSFDEFYKMPVVWIHYKRYKWLNNITRDFD